MNWFYFYLTLTIIFGIQKGVAHLTDEDVLQRIKRSTERDPYIFNLFEVILTTLESKLKRFENMDKTLQSMAKRLDAIEGQLSLTLNNTSKVSHLLEVKLDSQCQSGKFRANSPNHVKRVVRHRPHPTYLEETRPVTVNTVIRSLGNGNGNGGPKQPVTRRVTKNILTPSVPTPTLIRKGSSDSFWKEILGSVPTGAKMEAQLNEVVKRVGQIDSKISTLQKQIDTNMIVKPEELMASASESFRVGVGLGERSSKKNQDLGVLRQSVENVKNSIDSVDRRLQLHANTIDQSFSEMTRGMTSLKLTLDDFEKQRRVWLYCKDKNGPDGRNSTECTSPFEEIREKTQRILNSVVASQSADSFTKTNLKQEQEKQARKLEDLRKELAQQAKRILEDLEEVKKDIKKVKKGGSEREDVNPVALLQRSTTKMRLSKEDSQPPSDLLDQRILEERNSNDATESIADKTKSIGVILPPKPKTEFSFLSKSKEVSEPKEIEGYSCLDLYNEGEKKNGVYHLKIKGTTYWFLQVYCDMKTAGGGWTVIQRRDDYGSPRESFIRNWNDYKHGFGDNRREFWLGNENIFMLTNLDDYSLRVELEDFQGNKKYAEYSTFKLQNETEFYKLEIGGYSGNAGDSLNDPWYGSNLSPFSTMDRDNDRSSLNCAAMLKGGWWWRSCGRGLNGLYFTNPNDFTARQGIVWFRWKGWDYTLKRTALMIRPKQAR